VKTAPIHQSMTGLFAFKHNLRHCTSPQQVMGHASVMVSLTYLRGLNIRFIDQNDMPSLKIKD